MWSLFSWSWSSWSSWSWCLVIQLILAEISSLYRRQVVAAGYRGTGVTHCTVGALQGTVGRQDTNRPPRCRDKKWPGHLILPGEWWTAHLPPLVTPHHATEHQPLTGDQVSCILRPACPEPPAMASLSARAPGGSRCHPVKCPMADGCPDFPNCTRLHSYCTFASSSSQGNRDHLHAPHNSNPQLGFSVVAVVFIKHCLRGAGDVRVGCYGGMVWLGIRAEERMAFITGGARGVAGTVEGRFY